MTLRVLVVDDEPLAVDWLVRSLGGMAEVVLLGVARDAEEAAEAIRRERPDLVLLDIQMPGRSGLELARQLDGPGAPQVVFVTAYLEYGAAAFEVEAADYLLKPVRPDRLREAVRRADRRRRLAGLMEQEAAEGAAKGGEAAQPRYETDLWVPAKTGRVRVPVSHIQRVEAARDYVLIYTGARSHILRATMADLARRLDPEELFRVHRSAFVRLSTVVRIERNGRRPPQLHTADGVAIDVGVSYAKAVLDRLEGRGAPRCATCETP